MEVRVPGGPRNYVAAAYGCGRAAHSWKDPDPASRHVFAWSHVSASVRMRQPSDVHAFADMLVGYAGRLREVAEELAAAQREDLAARSERT